MTFGMDIDIFSCSFTCESVVLRCDACLCIEFR
jgi:hypothetical protein